MRNLVVSVFADRESALESVGALHDLNGRDGIEIETIRLIRKDRAGSVTEELTDDDFPPPSGTFAGLALGALIGLLGGSATAAVAAGMGAMIGLLRDLRESESHTDFVAEVACALNPGKYAILADVKEDSVTPLNLKMIEMGGVVFRAGRSNIIRGHRARQVAEFRAELDALIAHLAQDEGNIEGKLQNAIDRVRMLLEKRIEAARARSALASQKRRARTALLKRKAEEEQKQAESAQASCIERLHADYERRSDG